MRDIIDRFIAFGCVPDTYDAPTAAECLKIAAEVQALRIRAAAAEELAEALELAHAALSGANMNMKVVERKTRTSLAKYRTETKP